jgi:hypothetical protein
MVVPMADAVRSLFIPKENPMINSPAQIPTAMDPMTMKERTLERHMFRQATLNIMRAYF